MPALPPLPTRRRIFLLRHADVDYFTGRGELISTTTVGLNARGRAQAATLVRELADVPLQRIVASDLPRCLETAAALGTAHGLRIEPRPELREIEPGQLSDLPRQSLEQTFLGVFGSQLTLDDRFLGGETFGALHDRVLRCWSELLCDTSWRQLLVVAHGVVNRVILAHALGLPLRGIAALEQDPGCVNILDVDDAGRYLVRLLNHTPYNSSKVGMTRTTMERLYIQFCGIGDEPA